MRVKCEFCDNDVEILGNMTCPHCGGALANVAKAERERLEKLAEAERIRQAELEKERLKAEEKRLKAEAAESDNEKWGKILASGLGMGFLGRIRAFLRRVFSGIWGIVKILGVVALVLIIIYVYKTYFGG